MIALQFRKSARYARRLSTRYGRARSDIELSPQIVRQFIACDAIRSSLVSRSTAEHLVVSARFQSVGSPVALKSP
jgi:hypothetical protein